jgi:hypothetical protein
MVARARAPATPTTRGIMQVRTPTTADLDLLSPDLSFELSAVEAGTHLVFGNYQGLTEGTEAQARAALTDEGYAAVSELMGLSEDEPEEEFEKLESEE